MRTATLIARVAVTVGVLLALTNSSLTRSAGAANANSDPEVARLIVRSRVGLVASTREQILAVHGARRRGEIPRIGATVIEVPRRNLEHAKAALRRTGLFTSVENDAIAEATTLPNDPLFSSQWGTVVINAVESWEVTRGSADATVAVLDTGVDVSHPDLQGQLLGGYDFVNLDGDTGDDNGHGTAMTGIVVAATNNGVGIAGVASDSHVLPVKVLNAYGTGLYSDIAQGITYAVDQGARVVSMSLAGSQPSEVLQSAVDYARSRDVVVVAAAGNSGTSSPAYPAALDGVISVAATDQDDGRAWFSNYGSTISLASPGVSITTTQRGGGYGPSTGTSPATAMAAAAFSLLRAANPGMSAAEAVERMTANAVDLGTAGWDPYFGFGRVDTYAALIPGEIVRHVVDTTPPVASIFSPSKESLVYGIVPVDVHANDSAGVARVDLQVDSIPYASATLYPYSFAWETSGLSPGAHKLRATAYDSVGNSTRTTEIRVYVTPGVGLWVRQASLRTGSTAGTESISLNTMFSLPSGQTFDPASDQVGIELTSAAGTAFSITVPPGSLTLDRWRAFSASLPSDIPGNDLVTVKIKKNTFGNAYTLKLSGNVPYLSNVDTAMNIQVTIGSTAVSQAFTLAAPRRRPAGHIANLSPESLVFGNVPVEVQVFDDTVSRVDLEVDRQPYSNDTDAPYSFNWDTGEFAPGKHKLRAVIYDAFGSASKTKEIRLYVTNGLGLLARRVTVRPARTRGMDSISVRALFSLPSGVVLNPDTDPVSVQLDNALGTAFSVSLEPGSFDQVGVGSLRTSAICDTPAGGIVQVKIKKNRIGNAYTLIVAGTVPALGNLDSSSVLNLLVGGHLRTQSLSFRAVLNKLVAP